MTVGRRVGQACIGLVSCVSSHGTGRRYGAGGRFVGVLLVQSRRTWRSRKRRVMLGNSR
jgi:hypothetical protein